MIGFLVTTMRIEAVINVGTFGRLDLSLSTICLGSTTLPGVQPFEIALVLSLKILALETAVS